MLIEGILGSLFVAFVALVVYLARPYRPTLQPSVSGKDLVDEMIAELKEEYGGTVELEGTIIALGGMHAYLTFARHDTSDTTSFRCSQGLAVSLSRHLYQSGTLTLKDGGVQGFEPLIDSPLVTEMRARVLKFYALVQETSDASSVAYGQSPGGEEFMSDKALQGVAQGIWGVWSRPKVPTLIGIDAATVQKMTEGDLVDATVELQKSGGLIFPDSRITDVAFVDEGMTPEETQEAWRGFVRAQGWDKVDNIEAELGREPVTSTESEFPVGERGWVDYGPGSWPWQAAELDENGLPRGGINETY